MIPEILSDLPLPEPGEKTHWGMLPWEEAEYARFIRCLLQHAQTADEPAAGFANGCIDWVNEVEHSDILRGLKPGGWTDPSSKYVGMCSRVTDDDRVLVDEPFWMQVSFRDFSLVSLDAPNCMEDDGDGRFYTSVIMRLVGIQRTPRDNLYGWLRLMFEFCDGKPFAYYSRYAPSSRIFDLAREHDVNLTPIQLATVPADLLQRHQSFKFLEMTAPQWEEIRRRRPGVGQPLDR